MPNGWIRCGCDTSRQLRQIFYISKFSIFSFFHFLFCRCISAFFTTVLPHPKPSFFIFRYLQKSSDFSIFPIVKYRPAAVQLRQKKDSYQSVSLTVRVFYDYQMDAWATGAVRIYLTLSATRISSSSLKSADRIQNSAFSGSYHTMAGTFSESLGRIRSASCPFS